MNRQMSQAVTLYESFREKAPKKVITMPVSIPRVVAMMGHVEAIEYRTTHAGKVTLYKHDFGKGARPLLCVSGDGRQLMLLGGRYEWTDRGIQDEDASGRLIGNPKHGKTINPRKGTPAHICPICNKAGGSHCPDALHFLRLPGEYAHPRCVQKASAKVIGTAPVRAHTHKKIFYFETHADAKEYALTHGFPIDRIIPYQRGWAIQLRKSGPYVGNPKKPQSHKMLQKSFAAYVKAFKPSRVMQRKAIKLLKADSTGWIRAGWHRLFQAAETGKMQHAPRTNPKRSPRSRNASPMLAGYEDAKAGLVSYALKQRGGAAQKAYSDGYMTGAVERRNEIQNRRPV